MQATTMILLFTIVLFALAIAVRAIPKKPQFKNQEEVAEAIQKAAREL